MSDAFNLIFFSKNKKIKIPRKSSNKPTHWKLHLNPTNFDNLSKNCVDSGRATPKATTDDWTRAAKILLVKSSNENDKQDPINIIGRNYNPEQIENTLKMFLSNDKSIIDYLMQNLNQASLNLWGLMAVFPKLMMIYDAIFSEVEDLRTISLAAEKDEKTINVESTYYYSILHHKPVQLFEIPKNDLHFIQHKHPLLKVKEQISLVKKVEQITDTNRYVSIEFFDQLFDYNENHKLSKKQLIDQSSSTKNALETLSYIVGTKINLLRLANLSCQVIQFNDASNDSLKDITLTGTEKEHVIAGVTKRLSAYKDSRSKGLQSFLTHHYRDKTFTKAKLEHMSELIKYLEQLPKDGKFLENLTRALAAQKTVHVYTNGPRFKTNSGFNRALDDCLAFVEQYTQALNTKSCRFVVGHFG